MPLRVWFRWLARQHYLLNNPASEIELPRLEHRLPKHVLSVSEVEQVLAQPAIHDPLGLRDRAMMETLYSTGMRRMELIHLKIYDLDTDRGMLTIRQGKGKKDRVIPIGERAAAWVEKYLREVRPGLVTEPDDRTVFLSNAGEPFCLDHISNLVRDYVDRANIGKRGACHLFRHSMATLMLENGADIRFIQQMLGHADLNTTEIYTHVSIRKLKEIHTATHPARLKGKSAAKDVAAVGNSSAEANQDSPRMSNEPGAALERLILIAQGDSGQCRLVANFLLAWWNAAEYGGFDPTDLWAVDASIAEDILTVFAQVRRCRSYPDSLGYSQQFQAIVHRWRSGSNGD